MQFKKSTSFILAVLLLISNFGLAFNVHYCGDKIASFSPVFSTSQNEINDASLERFCCCEKKEKNLCCNDKVVDLKKDSTEVIVKIVSFQIDALPPVVKLAEIDLAKAEKCTSTRTIPSYFCNPNAPPLFKLYQQFIFYA